MSHKIQRSFGRPFIAITYSFYIANIFFSALVKKRKKFPFVIYIYIHIYLKYRKKVNQIY